MITVGNKTYELVHDHKNGWNQDSFRARYSEVLERYDYIVGDWGYNQLRLKGFFRDNHPKASKDALIGTVQDYLNEYCNFGCAYFILQKIPNAGKDKERKTQEQEPADTPHRSMPDGIESEKTEQEVQASGQDGQSGDAPANAEPNVEDHSRREHGRQDAAKGKIRSSSKPHHIQENGEKRQTP